MVGLVADDLTGACDSAVPFLRSGAVRVHLWPDLPSEPVDGCLAISTDSRRAEPADSRERSERATRRLRELGAAHLYRKLDSTFRGNVLEDLEGSLAAWPGTCLLAPALPEEGRVTRSGIQRWPGGEVDLKPLAERIGGRLRVLDACDAATLHAIAEEVAAAPGLFAAGSAGLALELAKVLSGRAEAPALDRRRPGRPLALIGSTIARPQAELALERGWEVRFRKKTDEVDLEGFDGLLLCGGSTAAGVLGRLGAGSIELQGEVAPRIPVGVARGGPWDGLPVVLKSGHFGGLDAIEVALESFTGRG